MSVIGTGQSYILALGNKWCKDNAMAKSNDALRILALGNKWCKDNSDGLKPAITTGEQNSGTWE